MPLAVRASQHDFLMDSMSGSSAAKTCERGEREAGRLEKNGGEVGETAFSSRRLQAHHASGPLFSPPSRFI